jgi:cysteine desulfurase
VKVERLMEGAGQEGGQRPGTENVLGIVGLGKACEIARRELAARADHMTRMRDRLEQELLNRLPGLRVNGHPTRRLPNTLNVSVLGLDANQLLANIADRVALSAGAACHSGEVRVSHVLRAMRISEEWARGTLRFSTGRTTQTSEIEKAVEIVVEAADPLRAKTAMRN